MNASVPRLKGYIFALANKHIMQRLGTSRHIRIDQILLGGDNDLRGWDYAILSHAFMRPSQRVKDGPYFDLLQKFEEYGEELFADFINSDYCQMALTSIDLFGDFFPGDVCVSDIEVVARQFIKDASSKTITNAPRPGHSQPHDAILVQRIRRTDLYQLIQGNHRVAAMLFRGETHVRVRVMAGRTWTPVAELLQRSLRWHGGYICQPVTTPEADYFPSCSGCIKRAEQVHLYFSKCALLPKLGTLIDLCASFGWFVKQGINLGLTARGYEVNGYAVLAGRILHGLNHNLERADGLTKLAERSESFDAVLHLSGLSNRQALARDRLPLRSLETLDAHCNQVLVLGICERGNRRDKPRFNTDHSMHKQIQWILDNSTFDSFDVVSNGEYHSCRGLSQSIGGVVAFYRQQGIR